MVALNVVVLMFMVQMMVCNNTYGIGNGAVYCNKLRICTINCALSTVSSLSETVAV